MALRNTRKPHVSGSRLPAPLQSSSQQPAYLAANPHAEASDRNSEFPRKLFNVLENVNLAAWIRWHEDEGILIPNVPEFVERVLRIYFPDMRKGWPSFQKQMSNYGFVKRDRVRDRAHYVHRDGKFCSGRPDLLPEVQPRPKESTSSYPVTVPEQHPGPAIPTVPQPPDRLNPDARLEHLQNKVAELERRLKAQESEEQRKVADLEKRLKVAEAEAAKVPELEKRLEATKVEAAKVPDLARQLMDMDTLIKQVLSPRGAGLSTMSGSPYTQAQTELVGAAVSNPYLMGGAGNSSGIHGGFTPGWSIDPYGGGAQLQGVPHHSAPGLPFTGFNPAPPQQSARLPNNPTPFPSSSRSSHHAAGLPAFQVPMLVQDSSLYLSSYAQQQNAGPWAGAQTFIPNGYVPARTSQDQDRTRSSNSPKTPNTRQPLGMSGVPPPPPPAPSRAGLGYFFPPFGPSNSSHQ